MSRCLLLVRKRFLGLFDGETAASDLQAEGTGAGTPGELMSPSIRIMQEVAGVYGVSLSVLRSHEGRYRLFEARREVAMALRKQRRLSLTQIGNFLGGRHPTSILHMLEDRKKRVLPLPSEALRLGRRLLLNVCAHHGISLDTLLSKFDEHELRALRRSAACMLKENGLTAQQIARLFGRRLDVMHYWLYPSVRTRRILANRRYRQQGRERRLLESAHAN